ncbi:hypothetical protein QQ045_023035 [Rhodiola kirilowii]
MEDEVQSLARQFNGMAAISIPKVIRKEAEKNYVHALALKFCCMKGVNKVVVAPLLRRSWYLWRLKVLEGGPWTGNDWALAVGEWDVDRNAENVIPIKVPMWAQVHNLPLVLVQEEYEDRFGLLMGEPVDVSKTSLVVHENLVQKNFFRVRPIVDGCYVFEEDEDESLWVDFKYERLPKYCMKCARLTHDTSICSLKKVEGDGFLYAYLRAELNNKDYKTDVKRPQAQKAVGFKGPGSKIGGLAITECRGDFRTNACPEGVVEASGMKRTMMTEYLNMDICGRDTLRDFENIGRKREGDQVALMKAKKGKAISEEDIEGYLNLNNQPYFLNQGPTDDFLLQDIVDAAVAACWSPAPPSAMKILVWNCRGLGSSSAVRALQELIRVYRPLVVGIVESKSSSSRCEVVRVKLGFDCCFAVPARGRSGGLALFWNNMSDVSVVSYSGYQGYWLICPSLKLK